MARTGSTSAPRAQASEHAGSQYSAPRASINPPQGLRSAGNSTGDGVTTHGQSGTTRPPAAGRGCGSWVKGLI